MQWIESYSEVERKGVKEERNERRCQKERYRIRITIGINGV